MISVISTKYLDKNPYQFADVQFIVLLYDLFYICKVSRDVYS